MLIHTTCSIEPATARPPPKHGLLLLNTQTRIPTFGLPSWAPAIGPLNMGPNLRSLFQASKTQVPVFGPPDRDPCFLARQTRALLSAAKNRALFFAVNRTYDFTLQTRIPAFSHPNTGLCIKPLQTWAPAFGHPNTGP